MSIKDPNYYNNLDLSISIEDRIKAIMYSLTQDPDYNGWDTNVLRAAKFISATPGRTEWEMTVTKDMCNKRKNMHGGCATTILDNLSSVTFLTIAKPGFMDAPTASRTILMSFLRPVTAGTKIRIIAETVTGGKTLALCKAQIETMDGKVCVTCVHDKAVISRPKL